MKGVARREVSLHRCANNKPHRRSTDTRWENNHVHELNHSQPLDTRVTHRNLVLHNHQSKASSAERAEPRWDNKPDGDANGQTQSGVPEEQFGPAVRQPVERSLFTSHVTLNISTYLRIQGLALAYGTACNLLLSPEKNNGRGYNLTQNCN